jgi:hypothetical protein
VTLWTLLRVGDFCTAAGGNDSLLSRSGLGRSITRAARYSKYVQSINIRRASSLGDTSMADDNFNIEKFTAAGSGSQSKRHLRPDKK